MADVTPEGLAHAATEMLEQAAFLMVSPCAEPPPPDADALAVQISLGGPVRGTLSLGGSAALGALAASNLLGLDEGSPASLRMRGTRLPSCST